MKSSAIQEFTSKHKTALDKAIDQEMSLRTSEAGAVSSHLVPLLSGLTELSVGGKRLRGLLTVLGYQLAGGTVTDAIYTAGAVMEIFHLGLLVHDDFMDRDTLRRGVPTIHARYGDHHFGETMAILAGDFTFGWSVEMLASLKIDSNRVQRAMIVWGKYFTRVGYGQTLDVIGEQRGDTGEDEVMQVLYLKSGEYSCVLPLQLGAALAGADENLMERLRAYGMELGWVFQLRDDWLSEYGDSAKTGKPTGNDQREARKSYATLYGKEATEKEIAHHVAAGKKLAQGNAILEGLLDWMASREN